MAGAHLWQKPCFCLPTGLELGERGCVGKLLSIGRDLLR
jgi:hypothetical protein